MSYRPSRLLRPFRFCFFPILALIAFSGKCVVAQPNFSRNGDASIQSLTVKSISANASVDGTTLSTLTSLARGAVPMSKIATPNGIASLDGGGAVLDSQLVARTLQAPVLVNGSATGTSIDSAVVGGVATSAYLRPIASKGPTVYLGGISNTTSMADPLAMTDIMASGKIGLYIHPYAPNFTWTAQITSAITAAFDPVGANAIELGSPINLSATEVTVKNTTSAPLAVPQETRFTDSNANVWYSVLYGDQLPSGVSQGACINGINNTVLVPSGVTCPLYVKSGSVGAITVGKDQITTSSVSGLTVLGNLPITAIDSGKTGYGVIGSADSPADSTANFLTSSSPGSFGYYKSLGISPTIATVNTDNASSGTSFEIPMWNAYVDTLRHLSTIKVVAPVLQPSGWVFTNNAADFVDDPFMVNFRQEAIYGGGIAFDSPPSWVINKWAPNYLTYIESMIGWAREQGLEVIWIVSPLKSDNATTFSDTKKLVTRLKADDRLPTRWVVENYEIAGQSLSSDCNAIGTANDTTRSSVTTVCSADQVAAGAKPMTYSYENSLNNIALFLAEEVGVAPAPASTANVASNGKMVTSALSGAGGHSVAPTRLSVADLRDGDSVLKSWMINQPFGLIGYNPNGQAMIHGGAILSGDNSDCNSANTAQTSFGSANFQGLTICWNHTKGAGETDFVDGIGLGSGGFNFYVAGLDGAIVEPPSSPILAIDQSGAKLTGILNLIGSAGSYARAYTDAGGSLTFDFVTGANGSLSSPIKISPTGAITAGSVSTSSESHFSASSSFTDPDVGKARDAKFGGDGIAVHGGTKTDTLAVAGLTQLGVMTVAQLPSTCTVGQIVYVTDGRKSGEASGAGTGILAACLRPNATDAAVWKGMTASETSVVN